MTATGDRRAVVMSAHVLTTTAPRPPMPSRVSVRQCECGCVFATPACDLAAAVAKPRNVHPCAQVEVNTPEEHMGDVIGDLNSRRGLIGEFIDKPANMKLVKASVPLSEMFQYVSTLRGMTKGALFSMKMYIASKANESYSLQTDGRARQSGGAELPCTRAVCVPEEQEKPAVLLHDDVIVPSLSPGFVGVQATAGVCGFGLSSVALVLAMSGAECCAAESEPCHCAIMQVAPNSACSSRSTTWCRPRSSRRLCRRRPSRPDVAARLQPS